VASTTALPAETYALIDLKGVIQPTAAPRDKIIEALQQAFKDRILKECAAHQQPGWEPVQAGYINDEIRACVRKIRISAACRGAGHLRVGGLLHCVRRQDLRGQGQPDRFHRRFDGWIGFTGTMEKLGVERRLITAGETRASWTFFPAECSTAGVCPEDGWRNSRAVH